MASFTLILIILAVLFFVLFYVTYQKLRNLKEKHKQLEYNYKSMGVKHGNQFESFVPFMENYPGEKENTVFIGRPVDFISFDSDNIKFIEVKTGKSVLNEKQRKIKELVENKKVEWYELRFEK